MTRTLALLLILLLPSWAGAQFLPPVYEMAAPANTVAPAISGDTEVGSVLTVSTGTWDNGVLSYSIVWKNDGVVIEGETGSTLDTTGLEAGDSITAERTALNALGSTTASSAAVVLTGAGNGDIESATINSDGDTLTVVMTGADTITDETGWSVAFDNGAARTLNYVSGSGTDTLVFDFVAVSPSTDERAPTGVDCLVSYDADTGNVGALADVGGLAVTNNSTQIPDPDLPQNEPDPTLPTGWDGTPDHTPADLAALNELCDEDGSGDAQPGDIVQLSGSYTGGQWVIKTGFGDAAGDPIVFIGADPEDLPASGTRVVEADESVMAVVSRTPTSVGHSTVEIQGDTDNFYFVGICFKSTGIFVNDDFLGPVLFLQAGVAINSANLPTKVHFRHCIVTVDNGITPKDTMRFDAIDSSIVDCCFHNLWGGSEDGSNATRTYRGGQILIQNNYFECMGAPFFLGANELTAVEDFVYRGNYHTRDASWNDGSHGTHKSSGEMKCGERVLIENNVFVNQWNTTFGAICIKTDGTGGPKTTTHVTARGNKMVDVAEGFNIYAAGSSDDDDVGPNSDILIEDNLVIVTGTGRALEWQVYDVDQAAPLSRVQVRHNTFIGTSFIISLTNGMTPGDQLVFMDNIMFGRFSVNGGGVGSTAFNWGWDDTYVATHNVLADPTYDDDFYDNSTDPVPLGTLTSNQFTTTLAGIGFTDSGNGDYSLSGGSAFATDSSTGGKPGYDSATCDPIWAGVEP